MSDESMMRVRKNAREEIRVSVEEYRGQQVANLRVWFQAADGTMRPGKDGIAFRVGILPEIAEAVNATLADARHRGLLDE